MARVRLVAGVMILLSASQAFGGKIHRRERRVPNIFIVEAAHKEKSAIHALAKSLTVTHDERWSRCQRLSSRHCCCRRRR
jgi:hypothetical protein